MKWSGWNKEQESNFIFALFIMSLIVLVAYFCFDLLLSRTSSLNRLGILSIPPLFYLLYWRIRTRFKALRFSLFLGLAVVVVSLVSFGIFLGDSMKLSAMHVLLFSTIYGIIAVNSCIIGLGMPDKTFSQEQSTFLRNISVFISIVIFLSAFILERVFIEKKMIYLNSLLISLIFLAIAVSFLYVVLGFSSRNRDGTYNPLVFLISATLCFSIGTTFSIFILEYGRILRVEGNIGILMSRWVFLCIWTIFMNSVPIFTSRRSIGLSRIMNWILGELVDD